MYCIFDWQEKESSYSKIYTADQFYPASGKNKCERDLKWLLNFFYGDSK